MHAVLSPTWGAWGCPHPAWAALSCLASKQQKCTLDFLL